MATEPKVKHLSLKDMIDKKVMDDASEIYLVDCRSGRDFDEEPVLNLRSR